MIDFVVQITNFTVISMHVKYTITMTRISKMNTAMPPVRFLGSVLQN